MDRLPDFKSFLGESSVDEDMKDINLGDVSFVVSFNIGKSSSYENPYFQFIPKTSDDLDLVNTNKSKYEKLLESYVKKYIKGNWEISRNSAVGITIEISKFDFEKTILNLLK